jgi:acylphosphatase
VTGPTDPSATVAGAAESLLYPVYPLEADPPVAGHGRRSGGVTVLPAASEGSKAMTDRVRAHVFVSGRVQGVFYRATTRETAEERGVDGWVRNLDDGRVEAVFEGPEADVESMVEWCHEGSPQAAVDDVDVESEDPDGIEGFEVRW